MVHVHVRVSEGAERTGLKTKDQVKLISQGFVKMDHVSLEEMDVILPRQKKA
jgi:hypothetical protein